MILQLLEIRFRVNARIEQISRSSVNAAGDQLRKYLEGELNEQEASGARAILKKWKSLHAKRMQNL